MTLALAVELSKDLCASSVGGPFEYLLEPLVEGPSRANNNTALLTPCPAGRGYPHTTLTQLFVKSCDIPELVQSVTAAVASLELPSGGTFRIVHTISPGGRAFAVTAEGHPVHLPSLVLATADGVDGAASDVVRLHEMKHPSRGSPTTMSRALSQ
jgi:hypothetical protein